MGSCIDLLQRHAVLISRADEVVSALVPHINNPRYTGGHLCLFRAKDNMILFVVKVGEPSEALREKTPKFCVEKCRRASRLGHLSSAQSRNPDEDMYSGAIMIEIDGEVHYLGFSGFPEEFDEMVITIPALSTSGFGLQNAEEILRISGNTQFATTLALLDN